MSYPCFSIDSKENSVKALSTTGPELLFSATGVQTQVTDLRYQE